MEGARGRGEASTSRGPSACPAPGTSTRPRCGECRSARRDRVELDRAFERDPELRVDTGLALAGLVELGVQGVFVREFVSRLRAAGPRVPPALSVLPAASVAIEAVAWRP